jgi:hypothetical protein
MNITISPKLFTKVSRYFSNPDDAFREAIQNAYRAYCPIDPSKPKPIIHIQVKGTADNGNTVTIANEGREITNAETLLSLASSEWENDVENDQDPAGLGVCALLAYSECVTWESAFGVVTVEGDKFFNSPQYREELTVHPKGTLPQGTCVTMHNVGEYNSAAKVRTTFTATTIIDRIKAITQFHTAVEFTLNGIKMSPHTALYYSDTTNVAIPGYQSTVRMLNKEQWGSLSRNYWGAEGLAIVWHGNLIHVNGTEVNKYLGHYGRQLERTLGKLRIRADRTNQMLVIVNDENVITPKLPDRNELVWDGKTIEFLAKAFEAWADAWLKRAEEWINLHIPAKCTALTATEYKHTLNKYEFVDNFWCEWKQRTEFSLYNSFAVMSKRGYGKRIQEEIAVRFNPEKSLDLEEDGVFVLDGTGEITNVPCGGADSVGGVVFDGDEGECETEDPLSEAGWYSTDNVEPSHILVAVMPTRSGYWTDPKYKDSNKYGLQIHHGGDGDVLKLYAVPATVPGEGTEVEAEFDARIKAFVADPANEPIAEVGTLWLLDSDPEGSVVPNSTTILSASQDSADTALQSAAEWYVDLIRLQYEDGGWDGDGTLEEYLKEQSAEWEQIQARMHGSIYVDGWGRLSDIGYTVKSNVFTVDVTARTVTTPDGVVHKVL